MGVFISIWLDTERQPKKIPLSVCAPRTYVVSGPIGEQTYLTNQIFRCPLSCQTETAAGNTNRKAAEECYHGTTETTFNLKLRRRRIKRPLIISKCVNTRRHINSDSFKPPFMPRFYLKCANLGVKPASFRNAVPVTSSFYFLKHKDAAGERRRSDRSS